MLYFFFILPFSVSGISIKFGKLVGQTGTWGFSAIIWAFNAYFFYLLIKICYDAVLTKSMIISTLFKDDLDIINENRIKKLDKLQIDILVLLLLSLFLIISPIFLILSDLGNESINVFGHLGGFLLGLLISPTIELLLDLKNKGFSKGIYLTIFILLIIIPAICWV